MNCPECEFIPSPWGCACVGHTTISAAMNDPVLYKLLLRTPSLDGKLIVCARSQEYRRSAPNE